MRLLVLTGPISLILSPTLLVFDTDIHGNANMHQSMLPSHGEAQAVVEGALRLYILQVCPPLSFRLEFSTHPSLHTHTHHIHAL